VSEKTLYSQKTKTWDTGLTTWELCICIAASPMPNWSLVQEFLTSPPKSFCVHGNSLQLFYMAGLVTRLAMRTLGTRLLHHVILFYHLVTGCIIGA